MPSHASEQSKNNQFNILESGDGDSLFVGVNHGGQLFIPKLIIPKLMQVGNKFGFWYEGNGADRSLIEKKIGDVKWSGSWDKLLTSNSSDFYYGLFSNSEDGTKKLVQSIEDKTKTILEALVGAGDSITHEAIHGKATKGKLIKFLNDCGSGLLDAAVKNRADKATLMAFINKGEKVMWPKDWRNEPTFASRVAARANKKRLENIMNRKGVYFLGSDHIQTLRLMNKDLKQAVTNTKE